MDLLNSEIVTGRSVLLGVLALSVTLISAKQFFAPGSGDKLPLHGIEHGSYQRRVVQHVYHAESMYREAYIKFKNTVYRITTADGEKVVVPNTYLEELRHKPEEEVNNIKAVAQIFETSITGLNAEAHFLNHLIRSDLTRNLPRITQRLTEEVDRSVRAELPEGKDWTPIVVNDHMLRILAIVSGNIFVGPELCYNEEYLQASINYTTDLFVAIRALKRWPKFLRPIGKFFTPQLKIIKEYREKVEKMLQPMVKELKTMMSQGYELPDSMLSWMIEKSEKWHVEDAELATTQLMLIMAAIHTTTMTTTHILYDLAAYPEYVKDLRNEINSVLNETGGVMTTQALFQMKLLDSFLSESQRHNPINMTRFQRYVQQPITLHDGTKIPAGVTIEVPHIAIVQDPELYPDPAKFDPYRFYRLRKGEAKDPIGYKNREQYQFVTVTKENMGFGYGRHACPGRFFAATEIKLIVARILLDYDLKLPEGQTERYPNIAIANNYVPDMKKELVFRRISE